MTMLIYTAVAIAFFILILGLLGKTRSFESAESAREHRAVPNAGNGRWLDLSERIFDPSDARWLAEELAFPKLANDLMVERKRLAIHWLQSLQASFDEVVRTPQLSAEEVPEDSSSGSWQMLWLTVRCKFLVAYALVVVRLLGPYHRLIPSFSWIPVPLRGEASFRRAALAHSRISH